MYTPATPYTPPSPPAPRDPVEAQRVEHTRTRRRLLYGMGRTDLENYLAQSIGNVRRSAWGPVDQTRNPFLQIWTQAAALYNSEPTVVAPDGGEDIPEIIANQGYWSLMQRIQRDTLGLREMLVRINPVDEHGVSLVAVPPDLVSVEVHPRRPNIPVAVREWMPDPDDADKWVQHVYDPRIPAYRAFDANGADVSERVLGGSFEGENYPWITPDGPILPFVVYRAAQTANAWDPYTGMQVVEGTFRLAVYYTMYGHLLKNGSWPQRVGVGLQPAGMSVNADGTAQGKVADPAIIELFEPIPDFTGQALLHQFQPAADPEKFLGSIRSYESDIVDAALGSAQVTRATSDIRSGYSLAVSREAQRELQRAYEPLFRRSDLDLLGKVSGLLGGPTKGWRITYNALPKDPAELAAELDHITKQVELGVLDRVSAYQLLHPGLTQAEATKAVEEIARINRSYAA